MRRLPCDGLFERVVASECTGLACYRTRYHRCTCLRHLPDPGAVRPRIFDSCRNRSQLSSKIRSVLRHCVWTPAAPPATLLVNPRSQIQRSGSSRGPHIPCPILRELRCVRVLAIRPRQKRLPTRGRPPRRFSRLTGHSVPRSTSPRFSLRSNLANRRRALPHHSRQRQFRRRPVLPRFRGRPAPCSPSCRGRPRGAGASRHSPAKR
ncbi:hypothetical protein SAMN05443574_106201 [Haloarcula vallismortis]|uniref:Uncharacterized protein n=1 Tax=Haloarcula vallismortis TaxID=28442 RepID=A0A1H2W727_HALVA|nr:hypothetical protein SAMN05443574_106201 [Haloarcula vallismortis]